MAFALGGEAGSRVANGLSLPISADTLLRHNEDLQAVGAALSSEWSQGQVEGQVNRLKLIKRQMYGRARFDLLKARALHAG